MGLQDYPEIKKGAEIKKVKLSRYAMRALRRRQDPTHS
jgi:hypothetical protein